MKKIPYGKSSYKEIRENNMYYVDKTKYIEILETMPDYQFFIRPRRFGKSLFISMLEAYYDQKGAVNFEKLFGDLYIGQNPTEAKNKYLVLRISFARIDTSQGEQGLIKGFDNLVISVVNSFFKKYEAVFAELKITKEYQNAIEALTYLEAKMQERDTKLVLLIDEYDNYANEIMLSDKELYYKLAEQGGYVKTFYKAVKDMTVTVISRIFMTGVSPIFLDDLTSGPNMFSNLTNKKSLNSMLGFTEEEVAKIIEDYAVEKYVDEQKLKEDMQYLYNGYKFNEDVAETIYNTDMVLYLINELNQEKKYPRNMIDENVKTDYSKIRKLAINFANTEELNEIAARNLEVGPINLPDRIKLESLYNPANKDLYYKALMYYLGMLTIKRADENKLVLGIPNYTIQTLYWDYIIQHLELGRISDDEEITEAMKQFRREGITDKLKGLYQKVRQDILSKEDLKWYNELTSKVIFLMIARRDGIYTIKSEHEVVNGYIDVYLKATTHLSQFAVYNYVVEFKHIKESEIKTKLKREKALAKVKKEALEQLEKYMQDYQIQADSGGKEIKKLVVTTLGKNDVEMVIL